MTSARCRSSTRPGARSIYSDLGFILLGFCVELARRRAAFGTVQRLRSAMLDSTPRDRCRFAAARRGPRGIGAPHRADAAAPRRPAARTTTGWRGPRQLRGSPRRLCRACGPLRHRARGGRVRANRAASGATRPDTLAAIHAFGDDARDQEEHGAGKFTRARLGHDAADLVLRDRLSASAFGHVGFTGTSLWIDPHRDRYYVLLTNRVCDGGSSEQMQEVRRAFHETLAAI